jgi:hypothetical protein
MTLEEFLSLIKSKGAHFTPPVSNNQITFTNATLQQHKLPILPRTFINLFTITGGINLDSGYIFGPNEVSRLNLYPIPSILDVNLDFARTQKNIEKTIFGRNDLFYFAFDAFGKCYLLDNITFKTLRSYDDCIKAISDCLIAGKI